LNLIDKTCNSNSDYERDDQLFFYYDAMCDGAATLQYLQTGGTGALFQKNQGRCISTNTVEFYQNPPPPPILVDVLRKSILKRINHHGL
jgi:hypothetical protein